MLKQIMKIRYNIDTETSINENFENDFQKIFNHIWISCLDRVNMFHGSKRKMKCFTKLQLQK